jgi:hypothetical protein
VGIEGPYEYNNNKRESSLMLLGVAMANDILATHMASASLCRTNGNRYKGLDIIYKIKGKKEVKCKFFALDEGKLIISTREGLLSLVDISKLEIFTCLYLCKSLEIPKA